jgi:hypothetical protein
MRAVISFLAIVLACSACVHDADDCRNTRTCDPPPDAGTTVIYVVSDAGVQCDGVCAPIGGESLGWTKGPFLLTRPMSKMLPTKNPCPDSAPKQTLQGYATPDQTLACPSCSCALPTGGCLLPETVTASPSPACPSDGDAGVPFDPPSSWDGGCTMNDAIVDVDCDGGTCVQSVTAIAMILTESCAPTTPAIPQDVKWADFAYTCEGEANGTCPSAGDICVPKATDGFALCVRHDGDDDVFTCPTGYPFRSVYYLGAEDTRMCAPCICEPPEASKCSSLVSFYADDACTEQIASVTATNASSMCAEVPPGSPLGSKQASPPTYTPGSCKPSGGQEIGSVQPTHPSTFCCQK